MRHFWDWIGSLVFVFISVKVLYKMKYLLGVLEDLSDDINDIKKKLGLKVEIRIKPQLEGSNILFIRKEVLEGKTLKDLKKTFGFWGFRKYKWHIESCLKDFPERKICPRCKNFIVKDLMSAMDVKIKKVISSY